MEQETKEYPIPFNTEMVKAILDGRKTMTRRPLKPQPCGIVMEWHCKETHDEDAVWIYHGVPHKVKWVNVEQGFRLAAMKCPYAMGDKLWVRETWGIYSGGEDGDLIPGTIPGANLVYRATDDMGELKGWKSPRFMPRWASRITLEIVDVKVERLQEISRTDCKREGLGNVHPSTGWMDFADIWNSLYAKKPEYQWKANPWLWVIEFQQASNPTPNLQERLRCPI